MLKYEIVLSEFKTYQLILSNLEKFIEGEKTFIALYSTNPTPITFNQGCCLWSKCLRELNSGEVYDYFHPGTSLMLFNDSDYEIEIAGTEYNNYNQYRKVESLDKSDYSCLKFPELPQWVQKYLLQRLKHAKQLLVIYEASVKRLEEKNKNE